MKIYSKLIVPIFAILLICSCKDNANNDERPTNSKTQIVANTRILPEWAKQANIYEVNIRQYTEQGTFDAFSSHLPRLKSMGVDILLLMPIFPISSSKKKGTLGSYYAVSDFRKTNPQFGSMESFENLLAKAHSLGMRVILDWVPNHTGWDHAWIQSSKEFYKQDKKENIKEPVDPKTGKSYGWTDVAALNYNNNDMREQMIDNLLFWVNEIKVDGYRMGVADDIPNDFWQDATNQLYAANNELYMLAESEDGTHINSGLFHTIYNSSMHNLFIDIASGTKNTNDLHKHLLEKDSPVSQGSYLNFVTNHDQNSWTGTMEERFANAADAMTVLAMTIDGFPLIYGGQEEPLDHRLDFFEKDNIGFKKYAKAKLLKTLLDLKHRNKAMGNNQYGSPLIRVGDSEHIYAFMKEKDGDKFAVMVNLSDKKQQIKLSKSVIGMTDLFNGRQVEMGQGTIKSFDPWEYWVASNK